jgi:hypothetical protein
MLYGGYIKMLNTICTAIAPVLASAALVVLVALVKAFGEAGVKFIQAKKAAVVAKTGAAKYNNNLTVAREVWGIVDEHFRINATLTKTVDSAAAKFEEEILKVIPGLTKDEIEHLRQAVAGEINRGRAVLTSDADTAAGTTEPDAAAQAAAAQAAADKLARLTKAALDLGVGVTSDMDAPAIQAAITAAMAA